MKNSIRTKNLSNHNYDCNLSISVVNVQDNQPYPVWTNGTIRALGVTPGTEFKIVVKPTNDGRDAFDFSVLTSLKLDGFSAFGGDIRPIESICANAEKGYYSFVNDPSVRMFRDTFTIDCLLDNTIGKMQTVGLKFGNDPSQSIASRLGIEATNTITLFVMPIDSAYKKGRYQEREDPDPENTRSLTNVVAGSQKMVSQGSFDPKKYGSVFANNAYEKVTFLYASPECLRTIGFYPENEVQQKSVVAAPAASWLTPLVEEAEQQQRDEVEKRENYSLTRVR